MRPSRHCVESCEQCPRDTFSLSPARRSLGLQQRCRPNIIVLWACQFIYYTFLQCEGWESVKSLMRITCVSRSLILSLMLVKVVRRSLQSSFDFVVSAFCFVATLRISCSCSHPQHFQLSRVSSFYGQKLLWPSFINGRKINNIPVLVYQSTEINQYRTYYLNKWTDLLE